MDAEQVSLTPDQKERLYRYVRRAVDEFTRMEFNTEPRFGMEEVYQGAPGDNHMYFDVAFPKVAFSLTYRNQTSPLGKLASPRFP